MNQKKRSSREEAIDKELIARGREVIHDFDASEELAVPARKRESKLISIRVPIDMMQQLRELAFVKGDIGYQGMIKRYIKEGLLREKQIEKKSEDVVLKKLHLLQQQISILQSRLESLEKKPGLKKAA